jgi:endonuclease YncB( thermonuclease family)
VIDAPEKGQAFGQRAKQAMSELVFGKDVKLRPHTIDRYGRLIARVIVDNQDAGLELLKEGLCWVAITGFDGSRREELNTPSADYCSAALPLSYTSFEKAD